MADEDGSDRFRPHRRLGGDDSETGVHDALGKSCGWREGGDRDLGFLFGLVWPPGGGGNTPHCLVVQQGRAPVAHWCLFLMHPAPSPMLHVEQCMGGKRACCKGGQQLQRKAWARHVVVRAFGYFVHTLCTAVTNTAWKLEALASMACRGLGQPTPCPRAHAHPCTPHVCTCVGVPCGMAAR